MPKTDSLFPPSHSAEGRKSRDDAAGRATALYSHAGARPEQQDNAHIWKNPRTGAILVVVCDGVGGSRGGGEASAIVVQTAGQLWRDRGESLPDPARDLLSLSRVAHERITDLAHEGEKRAPASTIVALYLTPAEAHWVHSGDSRLYRFQDSQLVSRTRDHSVVQILVDQGEVREKDMGFHPDQGRLLQSLGVQEYRPPAYASAPVDETDGFLLCTDGFWERTPPAQMAALLAAGPEGLKEQLRKAVHRAVRANGPKGDNVTAAVVAPLRAAAGGAGFRTRTYLLALLGVIVLAALFSTWAWLKKPGPGSPAKGKAEHGETSGVSSSPSPVPASATPPEKDRATPTPTPVATSTSSNAPPKGTPSFTPQTSVDAHRELVISDAGRQAVDLNKESCLIDGVRYWKVDVNGKVIFIAEVEVAEKTWRMVFLDAPQSSYPELPVAGVGVKQAQTFAAWLTDKHKTELPERWSFRLPTVEEWGATAGTLSFLPNNIKPVDLLRPSDKNPVGRTKIFDLFGKVSESLLGKISESAKVLDIVQDKSNFFAIGSYSVQPSWVKGLPKSLNQERALEILVETIKEAKQPFENANPVIVGLRLVLAPVEQPPAASPTDKPANSPVGSPAPGTPAGSAAIPLVNPAASPAGSLPASPTASPAASPTVAPKEDRNPRAEKSGDGNQPPFATPQPTVSGTVKPSPTPPPWTEIDDNRE